MRYDSGLFSKVSQFAFYYSLNKMKTFQEALAIRRIFSLVDMITKAQFSNCPNDF